MKLYTEEEIKRVFELFQHSSSDIPLYLQELKPIELPSDEEIRMQTQFATNDFYWGAKWMKKQILNQNK